MGRYWPCEKCDASGYTNRPGAKWWHFLYWKWCKERCDLCGGDGHARPPGWPDRAEMERLRPKLPMGSGPPPVPVVHRYAAYCRSAALCGTGVDEFVADQKSRR